MHQMLLAAGGAARLIAGKRRVPDLWVPERRSSTGMAEDWSSQGLEQPRAEAAENRGGRHLKHQKRPSVGQAICQIWPSSAEWDEPGERDEGTRYEWIHAEGVRSREADRRGSELRGSEQRWPIRRAPSRGCRSKGV